MKKLNFLVLLPVLILSACSKVNFSERENEKGDLLVEIIQISELDIEQIKDIDLTLNNEINPFDFVGEVIASVSKETFYCIEKGETNPESITKNFRSKLKQNLPENFYLDTANFDYVEKDIFDLLVGIYIKDSYDGFVLKSKLIEKSIINSCYFSEIQKKRVLTQSSTLRHIAGVLEDYSINYKTEKDETLKECWINKLDALRDCKDCYLEWVICIFSFPECLGVKLIDCIIHILIQAIF
jgi:hypothetical protein